MMLPHTTFSHLFSHHRDKFNFKFIGIGPSDDKLHSFWSEVVARKDPRIIRHPMCTRPNWTRRAIPIALHGDAVPVFGVGRPTTKSLDCYSWQSLLAFGPTMSIKMLISCIFEPTSSNMQTALRDQWMTFGRSSVGAWVHCLRADIQHTIG
jgi:hypothetical protein